MALAIRPIPTLTGDDAERFVKAAENVDKAPRKEKLRYSHQEVRKMWAQAFE